MGPLDSSWGTISLMYSVTMSSRTATESGEGFGSSPKAYIRSFTFSSMRKGRGDTVFLEEVLFTGVATTVGVFCHVCCQRRQSQNGQFMGSQH
jgi:hypothetical protein